MAIDTQGRLLNITIPKLDETLLAIELTGEDYLSAPFYFKVTVLVNNPLVVQDLLNSPVTLSISDNMNSKYYNGIIYQASYDDLSKQESGYRYDIVICPTLQLLADDIDSCVYYVAYPNKQTKTRLDIVKEVLQRSAGIVPTINLSAAYQDTPPLTVCVQYQESTLNFIHRLLNEAGLYYYFTHTSVQHTMVISNLPTPFVAPVYPALYSDETLSLPHISHLQRQIHAFPKNIKTQHYDFQKADQTYTVEKNTASAPANPLPGLPAFFAKPQQFYVDALRDANSQTLEHNNNALLNSDILIADRLTADSTYLQWQAGSSFSLTMAPQAYYIIAIGHRAHDYSQTLARDNEIQTSSYQNQFHAYSTSQAFLPQARYQEQNVFNQFHTLIPSDEATAAKQVAQPLFFSAENQMEATWLEKSNFINRLAVAIEQPCVNGLQLATVYASENRTLATDPYGQLKAEFDWDSGDEKFDWIRLKQPFASEGFGVQALPRAGQTIVARFNDGDPNQPLIMGTLPSQSMPFTPDKTPHRSGWNSHSFATDAADTHTGGHLICFDDNIKQPDILLSAYRDMQVSAENKGKTNAQVMGMTNTLLKKGDYTATTVDTLTITSPEIHLVVDQTRLSVTGTDITLEADKIELNPPGEAT